MRKINQAGINIIKTFEGCRLTAYLCPAGVWTVGYGHTGSSVKKGLKITQHQADVILVSDVEKFDRAVADLVPEANVNEHSALVSFAFNLGINALVKSTLLRKLKAGDKKGAAEEFMKWKYAAGKVLPGLVKRRAAERSLFLSPVDTSPA